MVAKTFAKRLLIGCCFFCFGLISSLSAEPPVVNPGAVTSMSLREADWRTVTVLASDPDNAANLLTYSWVFESDPTGQAMFIGSSDSALVKFGLNEGPSFPNPSFVGQLIKLRVDITDPDQETTSHWVDVSVTGVNHEPNISCSTSGLGTIANPRITGQSLGVDCSASTDPDGGVVKFLWVVSEGFSNTCSGGAVLFGNYTASPTMIVPELRAASRVTLRMIVEDGLHTIIQNHTGYGAPDSTPCATEPPPPTSGRAPQVQLTASPTQARWGERVFLTATVLNPDQGDTYTASWKQLGTTGAQNTVSLPNVTGLTNTFLAPSSFTGTLSFEVTVTDADGSGKATVSIGVSETGGTPPVNPPPGDGGVATGVTAGSCLNENNPAIAQVPATLTRQGGQTITISATGSQDQDNPPTQSPPVNGQTTTALGYEWTVKDGAGLLGTNDLRDRFTPTVRFQVAEQATQKLIKLSFTVKDAAGCGTSYDVDVYIQATTTNTGPSASLTYKLQNAQAVEAPASGNVPVVPPASIELNAGQSSDPDNDTLTYSWNLATAITGGGATLSTTTGPTTVLQLTGGTGTAAVGVTVNDGRGGSASKSIVFQLQASLNPPVAVASVLVDGTPLDGQAVTAGTPLILDPTGTNVPDGTGSEVLTYVWQKVGAPEVFSRTSSTWKGLAQEIATSVPAQAQVMVMVANVDQETDLTFRLTVKSGAQQDVVEIPVRVRPAPIGGTDEASGDLYFAQVGFGPVGDYLFRTVLVIDNPTLDDITDLNLEFFDQSTGEAVLDLRYRNRDGEVVLWDNSVTIRAETSAVIELFEPEGFTGLLQGWAHVSCTGKMRGSVRFQIVDRETDDFLTDVGIFASPRGEKFQVAYRKIDNLAFAFANPGEEDALIKAVLFDLEGQEVDAVPLLLDPGEHLAGFVLGSTKNDLFEENDLSQGTLVLEAVEGELIPTLLITRNMLAVSSQTFSKLTSSTESVAEE